MRSAEVIINRGRGPEIEGTRITVYDVLDWLIQGWHPHRIAAFFRISSAQVEAAIEYIREHTLEVITNYQKILERCARGNPPEVQAKLDANHGRFLEFVAKVRQLEETDPDVRREMIANMVREYRQAGAPGGDDAGDNGRS
jgi:uncharacterized protein (DUF433 family)